LAGIDDNISQLEKCIRCAQKSKVVVLSIDTTVSKPLLIDRPLKTTCIPLYYSVYEIAYCNSNRYLIKVVPWRQ